MSDELAAIVRDVGRQAGGAMWSLAEPTFMGWLRTHPAEVEALKQRIRRAVAEGTL